MSYEWCAKTNYSYNTFRFFVAQIWGAIIPNTNTLDDDPNSIYNYLSTESIGHLAERYSSDLEISWDVNKIFFKLWTRESGFSNPFEFNHETLVYELLEHNFDPNRPTKVLAHGFTDSVSFAEPFAKGKTLSHYFQLIWIQ